MKLRLKKSRSMPRSVVLHVSNHKRLNRFTGLFAGLLIAIYITFEAPISGMSMNPARSFASALPAQLWTGLWIYFTALPRSGCCWPPSSTSAPGTRRSAPSCITKTTIAASSAAAMPLGRQVLMF